MNDWTLTSTVALLDGRAMPRLGIGVWQCPSGKTYDVVSTALQTGYRHIDTARIYGNEKDVGRALRDSGVDRNTVFVTTKLWTEDHGYDEALRAFDASLARLDVGYVDLYLSHFPVAGKRLPAWKALASLVQGGRCRSIGVSNYTVNHLTELISTTGVIPAVNQVEFHPYLYQRDLLEFCRKHQIIVTAYSPLTHGKRLGDPRLGAIADRNGKTPAQVLIRWGLQQGMAVIPKSSRRERIEENADVFDFELSASDMTTLGTFDENLRTCWDPTDEP